jgi:hypothetical protein
MDTVRDIETPVEVRELTTATVLVRELERMLRQVARTDADFDTLVIMVRRQTPLVIEVGPASDVQDAYQLGDDAVVVHTSWLVSARGTFRRRLGDDLARWVIEHDDRRGVPCLRAGKLEIARAGASYEDALHLLGEHVTWLSVPDPLAETRGDDD